MAEVTTLDPSIYVTLGAHQSIGLKVTCFIYSVVNVTLFEPCSQDESPCPLSYLILLVPVYIYIFCYVTELEFNLETTIHVTQ